MNRSFSDCHGDHSFVIADRGCDPLEQRSLNFQCKLIACYASEGGWIAPMLPFSNFRLVRNRFLVALIHQSILSCIAAVTAEVKHESRLVKLMAVVFLRYLIFF